ncbi:MAG: Asp-tRNA(Asn)/Glu-tRNA(Gln) amidotransferase subunit GatB [Cardiobacteriaceae bacterium]|nr:Asp-tRNA(Asn)/Glu-tRNA(Gln) amidotransferase subunit GatB [Cardiobacteriaceae bacterium]
MRYEPVIGLELHIQLATQSKLFSSASAAFGALPNTHINEIDLAYPGVLPVLNEQALYFATLLGLAIGAEINPHAFFMRKNYFYPDLPKGYQISQLDDAIIKGGVIRISLKNGVREIRINRGQLEEDAGKSVHDAFIDRTGIDLNRAGVPLIELVSEPDLRSASEAVAYMKQLHHLVRYLGISDGNMQEGSFRCDANVSIREKGSNALNPRVELKNINSFRFVEQAINLEIERQSEIMASGSTVEQETRLFDPDLMETRTMRTKEEANDYRYFPDPDLLPLNLSPEWIEKVRQELPELPEQRTTRYQNVDGLDSETVQFILQTRDMADYYDAIVAICGDGKLAANWLQGEFARLFNDFTGNIKDVPLSAERFAGLLLRIKDNTISATVAKKLLAQMWENTETADTLIASQGLQQVNDDAQITMWVEEVIDAYPEQVKAYRAGQIKMLGFLTGQVIKRSQGQANPKTVNALLQEKLTA